MQLKTIQHIFRQAILTLKDVSDEPEDEARLILSYVLNTVPSNLHIFDQSTVSKKAYIEYRKILRKRRKRLPLAYIVKQWHFWDFTLYTPPHVFIPRPETEMLVRVVLDWCRRNPKKRYTFIDVGTGSGAIAIALAKECPHCEIIASDNCSQVIKTAIRNAKRNHVSEKIKFLKSNLLSEIRKLAIKPPLVIVANLPYIPSSRLLFLPNEVKKEPKIALDGGKDGFSLYRKLIQQIKWLRPMPEFIAFEIDHTQAKIGLEEANKILPVHEARVIQDLSNLDRYLTLSLNYKR